MKNRIYAVSRNTRLFRPSTMNLKAIFKLLYFFPKKMLLVNFCDVSWNRSLDILIRMMCQLSVGRFQHTAYTGNNPAGITSFPTLRKLSERESQERNSVWKGTSADLFCRWGGRWFTLHKQPSVIYRNSLHGQRRYRFPSAAIECDIALSSNRQADLSYAGNSVLFSFFRDSREGHGRIWRAILTATALQPDESSPECYLFGDIRALRAIKLYP